MGLFLILLPPIFAQVAINNTGAAPHPSSVLDVNAPDRGLLIPRVVLNATADNMSPVLNPATGLLVYNTSGNLPPGLYIWTGTSWSVIAMMDNLQGFLGPQTVPVYGEMYQYHVPGSSSSYAITSGTYASWTSASAGNLSGVTCSSSTLIIPEPGIYKAEFNCTAKHGGGKILEAALFVNGNRQDNLSSRTWGKEGGKPYALSFTGLTGLSAGDEVSIGFTFTNGSGTLELEIANLNLLKID